MSFFLVFLAILLAAGLVWFAAGVVRGRPALGTGTQSEFADGFDEPPAQLPPVLLPEHPTPDDVDRVRFSLAFRGYRMDQVDQVLETLRDRIGVQAALIEALTEQLRQRRAEDAAGSPSAGSPTDA